MFDHSQKRARIVHEVDDAERFDPPTPRGKWPIQLGEVLGLCASLRDAGYPAGDIVARVEAITEALDQAQMVDPVSKWLDGDLLDLDVVQVVERCRQAGIDRASISEQASVRTHINARFTHVAAAAIRSDSDSIIEAMRTKFNPALKCVTTAVTAGITSTTVPATLAETGTAGQIAAFRALGPAVTILDQIVGLRWQLADIAGVGPATTPMACILERADSVADLEGAQNLWRGEHEVVQHDIEPNGSTMVRIRRPRVGGPWVALVRSGCKLRLNSGAEADALVANAKRTP